LLGAAGCLLGAAGCLLGACWVLAGCLLGVFSVLAGPKPPQYLQTTQQNPL